MSVKNKGKPVKKPSRKNPCGAEDKCNGNGECKEEKKKKYCQCKTGFLGFDCSWNKADLEALRNDTKAIAS